MVTPRNPAPGATIPSNASVRITIFWYLMATCSMRANLVETAFVRELCETDER